MGRWYFDKKDTVEDCRSVSIAFLKKHDYFCGYRSGTISWTNWYGEQTASIGVTVCTTDGENYARFQYTHTRRSTGEKTECDYKVQLVTTPCHLGGVRWWFICPLTTNGRCCGRRVGKLYCPPGGMSHVGQVNTRHTARSLLATRRRNVHIVTRWSWRFPPEHIAYSGFDLVTGSCCGKTVSLTTERSFD